MDSINDPVSKPLSTQDLHDLNAWLHEQAHTSIFEVHGFLAAIVCSPMDISSATWLPAMLHHRRLDNDDQHSMSMLMQLKTDITAQFSQYEVVYPLVDFPPAAPFAMNHFSAIQRKHLALWCQGYLAATV